MATSSAEDRVSALGDEASPPPSTDDDAVVELPTAASTTDNTDDKNTETANTANTVNTAEKAEKAETEVERQAIQFVFDCLDEPDIVVGASPADLFSYTYLRENVEKQSEMMWRSALPPGENEQPKKDMKQKKVKGGKKQKQAQQ